MKENKRTSDGIGSNFVENLWYNFVPYWILIVVLSTIFLALAVIYALNETPTYNVAATLVINNEEENNNYSQSFRALNAYATRQVVDNEVLFLQSRSLVKNIVTKLHLYTPVFEQKSLSAVSAYLSSPIIIEAKEPDNIEKNEREKVVFEFNIRDSSVVIGNKHYPLNEWVVFPFGTLKFKSNPRKKAPSGGVLYFQLQKPSIVADELLDKLEVNAVSKLSTAINLSFKTEQPEKGEDILNELIKEYLHATVANQSSLAANTLSFADDRLREVERELDSIEKRIQQFRTSQGVVDLSTQGRIYLENVAENNRQIVEVNAQMGVLDQVERYINAEGQRTGIVPTTLGIDDPVLAQLLQTLNELELQLANTRTIVGENNPKVKSIENEIRKIRPNVRTIVNNQKARLRATRNSLTAASNRTNQDIRNIPQQERELLEISRQQAVKRELYAFLLQRREEAALSNASTIAANRIVDWADASVATKNSKKLIIIVGSLVLALGLSFGYIFYKESLNGRVLFRSEIERFTSIPVVAEINYKKHRTPLLIQNDTKSVVAEQFRQLEASLDLLQSNVTQKKILVTSNIPNEGKSFISSNLAISLSLSGKRVVLLDLNLLHPELTTKFQLEKGKGVVNYLRSEAELTALINKTQFKDLDVVPAGSSVNNSTGLLMQEKLAVLFHYLEQNYDHIIIDVPPIELATDAYLLSQYADINLIVVRHQFTPKTLLRRLDDNRNLDKMKNRSIVYNGIKGRGFLKKYYGYGYGYGYERIYRSKKYPVLA